MKTTLMGAVVVVGMVAVQSEQANGSPLLLSFNPLATDTGAYCVGDAFTVLSDITVNSLGVYDGGVGLNATHAVGLWDSSQNLLGSVTISNADPSNGLFKYHTLGASIDLLSGQTYFLAAQTGGDTWTYLADSFVFDPSVVFVGSFYTSSNSFGFPDTDASTVRQYMNVNLDFSLTTPVPETSHVLLAAVGALAIAGFARRRFSAAA